MPCKSTKMHLQVPIFVLVWAQVCVALLYAQRQRWIDEYTTHWAITAPVGTLMERVAFSQGNSPLYYVLLSGLYRLFGDSALVGRLFSASCVTFALIFIFVYHIRRWSGFRWYSGVVVALLVTFSYRAVAPSMNERAYGVSMLCLALLSVAIRSFFETRKRYYLLVSLMLLLIGVLLHPTTLFLTLGYLLQFGFCTPQLKKRTKLLGLMSIVLVVGLIMGDKLLAHYQNALSLRWVPDGLVWYGVVLPTIPVLCVLFCFNLRLNKQAVLLCAVESIFPLFVSLTTCIFFQNHALLAARYSNWSLIGITNLLLLVGTHIDLKRASHVMFAGVVVLLHVILYDAPFIHDVIFKRSSGPQSYSAVSTEDWKGVVEHVCRGASGERVYVWAGLAEQVLSSTRSSPFLSSLVTWPLNVNLKGKCERVVRQIEYKSDCDGLDANYIISRESFGIPDVACSEAKRLQPVDSLVGLVIYRLDGEGGGRGMASMTSDRP